MKQINYPRVTKDLNGNYYITAYFEGKRYRLYTGKKIGINLNPNTFPSSKRASMANLLASKVYIYLLGKKSPLNVTEKPLKDIEIIQNTLNKKLEENFSKSYKNTLLYCYNLLNEATSKDGRITKNTINNILKKYSSNTSYNTIRKHLMVLVNDAKISGLCVTGLSSVKSKIQKEILHKPIENLTDLLDDIKKFNFSLYLCCLMTYGCLLRPHQEIRRLCWGDFSRDLSQINLSGSRNKSGRNRIVPVPKYISKHLTKGEPHHNIFTGKGSAPNADYFKTLWTRYSKKSHLISKNQTLYSFRHTGAIEIFKRTGSITKLQSAMGHSSIKVSLIYLRGLEIPELTEEDMPNF